MIITNMYYMVIIITLISATLYFTSPATRTVMETLQTDDRANIPRHEIVTMLRQYNHNATDTNIDELLYE